MTYTMLLADDSVTTHRVMELTFAGQGIRVMAVTDGEQAIAWMNATRPDIVAAEVALPRVDGYRLSEHVRCTPGLTDVPVLLMTGTFDVVDDERVRACGAAGIIVRPFEPEVVIKRVKDLLGISPRASEPVSTRLVTALDAPSEPQATETTAPEAPVVEQAVEEAEQAPAAAAGASTATAGTTTGGEAQGGQPLAGTKEAPSPTASPVTAPATAAPIFEIDEELFGGALEAQRQKLSAINQGSPEPGQQPTENPGIAAAERPKDATKEATRAVAPSAEPRTEGAAESRERGPGASFGAPLPDIPVVAESFQSLLTAVQETAPQTLPSATISDEVVERIALRVAERLSEGVFVDTVRRVVEDIAERLVREEIARIRARVEERTR